MDFERPEHAERTVVDHSLAGVKAFRQAVLDLIPDVRKRADDAERERRIPAETMASLRKAGLFRAFVPRVYGGDERTLSEVLDATTDLAAGCPSTAWVGTLFAIHNIAVCWLEKRGQDEIFADGPDVLVASSVAPMGTLVHAEGGFRLTGRWAFSSGVEHASWVMVGANLKSESGNTPAEYVFSFVRASEVTLVDDWHVAGLRATGSKSLELKNVFVPHHRVVLLKTVQDGTAPGLAIHTQPFYRLPWYPVFICAFPAAGWERLLRCSKVSANTSDRASTAFRVSHSRPLRGRRCAWPKLRQRSTRLAWFSGAMSPHWIVLRRKTGRYGLERPRESCMTLRSSWTPAAVPCFALSRKRRKSSVRKQSVAAAFPRHPRDDPARGDGHRPRG